MTATLQDAVPRVFVSHSQEDSAFCHQLIQDLRHALGDDDAIWYEPDEEVAWSVVVQELTTRPIFVVILSPAAMTSPHVQYEIDLAWKQKNSPEGKEIIPVLYRPCAVRPDLGILHIVDLLPPRKYEAELVQLLKSIKDARVMLGRQQSYAPAGVQEEPELSGAQSGAHGEKETPSVKGSTHIIGRRQFITKAGLAFGAAATLGVIVYSRIASTSTSLTHTSSKSVSRVRWRYQTTGPVTDTPVAVDEVICVTSQDGYIYGLDASNGMLRWSYLPNNQTQIPQVFSAPVADNGVIYAVWGDHYIYALDASNGQVRWSYTAGVRSINRFSVPVVIDGTVYVSSTTNFSNKYLVYTFDASNGKVLAQYSLPNSKISIIASSTPAVTDGVICVSADSYVYGFDIHTRQLLWSYPTTVDEPVSLVISSSLIYFGSQDHLVRAIDSITGDFSWQYVTGDYIRSAPTVVDGVLYVGSADQHVYALDASSGKLRWIYEVGVPVGSSPVVAGGKVYITADDHALYILDAKNGHLLQRYPVGNDILTSPLVADGIAYIGSSDRSVYALDLQ